jgi:hypothetical protein
MKADWKKNGPVVLGGTGGSGTRLVAEICASLGIFIGDDLGPALDNLLYTLLFRRKTWFYRSYQNKKRIGTGLNLMKKIILKEYLLTPREIWFLSYAVLDMSLHYRDDRLWPFIRLQNILCNPRFSAAPYLGWGWKEPNSYLILNHLQDNFPSLKFIHVIRHGVDMAFSKNQRQFRAYGGIFSVSYPDNTEEIPRASLQYWTRANESVARIGESLGSNHYLRVNFDLLCTEPERTVDDIITFLGIEVDLETRQKAYKLPRIPSSLGRYKDHDLSQFDPGDLDIVRSFGFSLEQ